MNSIIFSCSFPVRLIVQIHAHSLALFSATNKLLDIEITQQPCIFTVLVIIPYTALCFSTLQVTGLAGLPIL
ncbi:hypothetical protein ACJX0J_014986, partial [Zea mays]